MLSGYLATGTPRSTPRSAGSTRRSDLELRATSSSPEGLTPWSRNRIAEVHIYVPPRCVSLCRRGCYLCAALVECRAPRTAHPPNHVAPSANRPPLSIDTVLILPQHLLLASNVSFPSSIYAMSHRRRGVGVGRSNKLAQKKADELKAVSLQSALDTVEKLELRLSDFAKRHQNEIQRDPVFRQRFLQLCAPLGVDPLSSKKSFWGKLLGMGDFYHELAVQVAEVCLASRPRNGGIMSVSEVQSILSQRRTRMGLKQQRNVSQADILIAIQKLAPLGGGFRTMEVGKATMVVSVPTELDQDHTQVLGLAEAHVGRGLSVDEVLDATGWGRDRAERALQLLLQEGMAWLDTYLGRDLYWFASVWQTREEVF